MSRRESETMYMHSRWTDKNYWHWLAYQVAIGRSDLKPGMYKRISPFAYVEGKQ